MIEIGAISSFFGIYKRHFMYLNMGKDKLYNKLNNLIHSINSFYGKLWYFVSKKHLFMISKINWTNAVTKIAIPKYVANYVF